MSMNQRLRGDSQTVVDTGPQSQIESRSKSASWQDKSTSSCPRTKRKWRTNGTHAAREVKPKDHMVLGSEIWLKWLFCNFPSPLRPE